MIKQYHPHIDDCQCIVSIVVNSETWTTAPSTSSIALQLKALGDETRLSLLLKVASAESEDGACICDLTPDTKLAQSTVSHHMKLLVGAGLLSRTQRGKWAYFSLTPAATNVLNAVGLGSGVYADGGDDQ